MTEDSQSGVRGYGPFQEGAGPAVPSQENQPRADQAGTPVPAQDTNTPEPAEPAQTAEELWAAQHPATYPPPLGSPASGAPSGAYPPGGAPYPSPASGAPYASPASGAPYFSPSSGAPYPSPASGAPYSSPASGAPYSSAPTSGPTNGPASGPASGPMSAPTSGSPFSDPSPGYGPFNPAAPSPLDYTPAAAPGRRIEPSPPRDNNRLIIGLVAGLVAGLLVFGTGGWFTGRATAPKAKGGTTTTVSPSPSASLGAFEQTQATLNQPHFTGTGLVPISQGWLPYVSDCARNGESGGPALNSGEKTRVRCALNGMSVIFVEYASTSDRDKARVKTLGQNVDARTLTPGVGAATVRATPSGRTNGNYVEYAYTLTQSGHSRPVAAIWWDDAQTPVAAYVLAFWKEGLGESWAPMRDLWSRYA